MRQHLGKTRLHSHKGQRWYFGIAIDPSSDATPTHAQLLFSSCSLWCTSTFARWRVFQVSFGQTRPFGVGLANTRCRCTLDKWCDTDTYRGSTSATIDVEISDRYTTHQSRGEIMQRDWRATKDNFFLDYTTIGLYTGSKKVGWW